MNDKQLQAALEALLFVSDEPVSAAELSRILDVLPSEADGALNLLATSYAEEERGIQLREVAGGWRLYSHPAYHELIEKYIVSWDTRSLSTAALETLAVVAYHQPVTRAEINNVRGVNSEGVLLSLIEKGLVRETGRAPGPGNAILYGTSRAFLERFGLASLKDLPPLEDFAPDEASRDYIRERLSGSFGASEQFEIDEDELAERIKTAEQFEADGRLETTELTRSDEQSETPEHVNIDEQIETTDDE
ncbi:MAG: SMC-Scp complex subunit ScpB [Coriobacteriales bacterium]|jgi:segregation and condensation protein B|nr:SMC-Scp complex subunit ScpB [Coriobacteriales bacterium]